MSQRSLLLALALLASAHTFAKGIKCSHDARPVDGSYTEVRVEEGKNGFDVTHKVITSGFGSPAQTKETVLAKGLKCTLDDLVAYCYKAGSESGESQNSIATFKIVEVTELSSLKEVTAKKGDPTVSIEVSSPLSSGTKSFEFQAKRRFGDCQAL